MTLFVSDRNVSESAAQRLLDAAAGKAREIGVPMSIAIVGKEGNLSAFRRMDGCPILAVDIAINKAYSAAAFRMSTHEWFDFVKDDEPLRLSIVHTPRLTTFGGGYPIMFDDECLGAIGISGGHYTQDMVCAEAALAVLTAELATQAGGF